MEPFGDFLLQRKLVTRDQVRQALRDQESGGHTKRIGEVLVDLGHLEPAKLDGALAERFGVPAFDPTMPPDPSALEVVPRDFAEAQGILPVRVDDGVLQVATAYPDDTGLFQFIADKTGMKVQPLAASLRTIDEYSNAVFNALSAVDDHIATYASTAEPIRTDAATADLAALTADAPVVQIVNIFLTEGLRERASDIHIEPQTNRVRVRFRVDGALRDVKDLPPQVGPAIASRIKVMSDLDIVERHRSQDGQFAVNVDGRDVDVRVSTTETIWGEKIVLRLLDRTRSVIGLAELGMPPDLTPRWQQAVHVPFGMIVCAGPTGAGKTTTLYASLNELDRQERNITTIEDPVEYVFPDITQIQINKAAGRSFADGLRAILRQDPDVILIGEVRDRETAEIATQAALTGHTVFCSVHATDSVAALHRFLDMGVDDYLLAPALEAVVAQRLVRRICPHCTVPHEPTPEEVALFERVMGWTKTDFWEGRGCARCRGTGYYDRIGIFELLRVDDAVKELIVHDAPTRQIRQAAEAAGMVPLRDAAMQKVADNETTISEVIRTVYAT